MTPDLHDVPELPLLDGQLPVLVTDTREQTPLTFTRFRSVPGTLTTGDYSIRGLEHHFAIERKSLPDLIGCMVGDNRERLARELHRLNGFAFRRLLVTCPEAEINAGLWRSRITPKVVRHTLAAIEARGCPVVFAETPEDAARRIEYWAFWFTREHLRSAKAIITAAGSNYPCGAKNP
jgi:DNA excision repair protein ERCC-4